MKLVSQAQYLLMTFPVLMAGEGLFFVFERQ